MTDKESIEARIRDLEHKLDSVHDEIYQMNHRLDRRFNEVNRNIDRKSDRLSWGIIKLFGGSVFLIIFAMMLMLPFLIIGSQKSQQTIIQMPARVIEQNSDEHIMPEIKMPPVEQTPSSDRNTIEEQPTAQNHARENFLIGLFSDLPSTVQHATMIGVIVCLFKLVMQ